MCGIAPSRVSRRARDVRFDPARLFVHGQPQPTLIVNDVKSGAQARGAIALWIDAGTVAHFRDVRVTPSADRR